LIRLANWKLDPGEPRVSLASPVQQAPELARLGLGLLTDTSTPHRVAFDCVFRNVELLRICSDRVDKVHENLAR
jgi:hypothetical protein